jgi:ribosome-binding protein aMBF1 (putative translation factor)
MSTESEARWRDALAAPGRLVREARRVAGLSLRGAAPRCGVHYVTLQQIETGRDLPTYDHARQIETGLSCPGLVDAVELALVARWVLRAGSRP